MYQTLYRKYRPKNLSEVSGQKVIIKILENQVKNDQISHGYIFSGPRGTGKTSVAKIFAKIVNCMESEKPCNKCVSCTQINNNQSLDIIEIDAASNNGVDEIRELKAKIGLSPSNSKYKVYIIDEVHMLTIAAFNALLKTLEEPPAHAIFILATTELHKIPETILSRCQQLAFKRISESDIVDRLMYIAGKENINIEVLALNEIARLSNGGLRDSIGLLELVSSYQTGLITSTDVHDVNGTISSENIYDIIANLDRGSEKNVLELIEKLYSSGKNLTKVLEEMTFFLRNCLLSYHVDEIEKNEYYLKTNDRFNYKKIIEIINYINENLIEIKKYGNNKIMIEILFLNMINKFGVENSKKEIVNSVGIENLKIPNVDILKENETLNDLEKTEITTTIDLSNNIKDVQNEQKNAVNVENNSSKNLIVENFETIELKLFKNDSSKNDKLEILKRIRVDNTLASVSKTKLSEIKDLISGVEIINLAELYVKNFHFLLDGEIKAASDKNFIIVYETQTLVDYYNKHIKDFEKMLNKLLKIKYSTIALTSSEWNFYRDEFKNKKRDYVYFEETNQLEEYLNTEKKEKNTIESAFADLIQVR